MTKILLVEDDKNLSEIYKVRLEAEGYQILSAPDGEEALSMATAERPDLIISDIMMPKISGFDMLDILRSTPETKGTKVILMTALSGNEQRERGESLQADKYLVKSQVGIEDVINAVHQVLRDKNGGGAVGAEAQAQPEPADGYAGAPAPEAAAFGSTAPAQPQMPSDAGAGFEGESAAGNPFIAPPEQNF